VAQFAAGGAEVLGDDPAAAHATAERIWDRTPGTDPAVHANNQSLGSGGPPVPLPSPPA